MVATYAVGDIQGCFRTLERLLHRIRFDASKDRLWLVGDLVNRGPRSLEVLRWARAAGSRLTMVLGNHDLHLLARAQGVRKPKPLDTLDEVLSAPDRDELLSWLRSQPLLHREDSFLLVHAGVLPQWSSDEAAAVAREIEEVLRSERSWELLAGLYRECDFPVWSASLSAADRLPLAINVLTKLRVCTAEGRPCLDYGGPPDGAPRGCAPWFEAPDRATRAETVVFGHWSDLGLRVEPGILALDTGCVWGRTLTAVRLEDQAIYQEPLAD